MSSGGPYGLGSGGPRLRPLLDVHNLNLSQPVGVGGIRGIRPLNLGDNQGFHPVEIAPPQLPSQVPQPGANLPQASGTQLTDEQINQIRGIGEKAKALPEELRKEYITSQLHDFQLRNIPRSAQHDVLDVIYQKGRFAMPRHKSVLTRIGQGLQAIESSGAGFAAGYFDYLDKHYGSGGGHDAGPGGLTQTLHEISPWAQYHAIGAGFKDVAPAVHEGYTYTDLVKASNDPGSLAYRWAKPIGLGMSVAFDPLTYTTFGASSVGKEAATRILANQELHAYTEADKLIRAGHYGGDMNRLHEAAMDVKVKNGYALTIGDAMDQLHETGLALKQEIRSTGGYIDPTTKQFVKAGIRGKSGAWLAPTSALGARGIRFAGKQIPGTARAGAITGAAVRGGASGVAALRDLSAGVVPDWAARHVAGDGLRASALVEMASWRAAKQTMTAQIGQDVHALQKVKVYPEAEQGAVNLAGGPDVLKVSPAARRDLMTHSIEDLPDGALKNLHNNITVEAKQFISHAVDAGGDRNQLEHQWEYLSKKAYHDPLAALFDFKLKTATQVGVRDWTDHLLTDRRFAIPMHHGADRIAIEKSSFEKPLASGALRPTHLGTRSVVMTDDGLEHTIGKMDPRDFVAGVIHDVHGTPLNVSDIRQVRNSADELVWREKGFVPTGLGTKLLRDVPAGYQSFTHAGRRYAVLDPIADALRELHNPAVMNPNIQRWLHRANFVQNWWKIYATSPNPSFHVMNFLGAMWNNQLAGVYNPVDYIDAAALLLRSRKESAAQAGEKFLFGTPQSTAKGRAALRTFDEAANRTGLGRSSFLFADIAKGDRSLPTDIEREIGHVGQDRGMLGKIVAPPEGSSVKQIARFYTTTRGRQAVGAGIALSMNPMGLFLLAPEAAKIGQRVTGTIEDVVRLAPFMKYSKDPVIKQVLHRYGPISVDGMTHPRWTKAEQAAMYDIGASITQHFQFDYTNLTDTERYLAKSVFPFWTYYKNNFVLQAKELVKHPRSFAAATSMMNFLSQQGQDLGPYASVLPQYFENIQAFQIPVPAFARQKLGLPHDQPLFLNPKMPFLSLNLIPPLWDIINDPHQTTSQRILELIAPVEGNIGPFAPFPVPGGKLLLEAGTGHNLGLNRPIDFQRLSSNDYRQSYVDAPSWARYMPAPLQRFMGVFPNKKTGRLTMTATSQYILQQVSTPFINNLGQSIPVGGTTDVGRGKARADMVSWVTGVRLIPADVLRLSRNEAYTMKNILEAKQSALRAQGKELNDKDYDILQNVKYDLEGINAAWDQREGIKP